jgi:hypothetical protein
LCTVQGEGHKPRAIDLKTFKNIRLPVEREPQKGHSPREAKAALVAHLIRVIGSDLDASVAMDRKIGRPLVTARASTDCGVRGRVGVMPHGIGPKGRGPAIAPPFPERLVELEKGLARVRGEDENPGGQIAEPRGQSLRWSPRITRVTRHPQPGEFLIPP